MEQNTQSGYAKVSLDSNGSIPETQEEEVAKEEGQPDDESLPSPPSLKAEHHGVQLHRHLKLVKHDSETLVEAPGGSMLIVEGTVPTTEEQLYIQTKLMQDKVEDAEDTSILSEDEEELALNDNDDDADRVHFTHEDSSGNVNAVLRGMGVYKVNSPSAKPSRRLRSRSTDSAGSASSAGRVKTTKSTKSAPLIEEVQTTKSEPMQAAKSLGPTHTLSEPGKTCSGNLDAADLEKGLDTPKTSHQLLGTVETAEQFKNLTARVIFPDNKVMLFWDILIFLLICFIVMYVPFQVGVSDGQLAYQSGEAYLFGTLMNLVFIVDIVLNFFRAYTAKNGLLVFNRRKIVRHYLYGWFLIDLLACFPVDSLYRWVPNDFTIGNTGINLISFINLLRVFRVNRANKIIHSNTHVLHFRLRTFNYSAEFFRIVVILTVYGHWIGCMFCFVALLEAGSFREIDMMNPQRVNWLQVYVERGGYVNVVGNSFQAAWGRYTLGLYWAFTTTTSIGYGDITPQTMAEIWYVTIIMLSAGLVWAWVIGQIFSLVEEMNDSQRQFRSHLVQLNRLVDASQEEDPQVSKDARIFLFRQNKMSLGGARDGMLLISLKPVLSKLPVKLRNLVCVSLIKRDLMQVSFFRHPSIQSDTLGGIASLCEIHQYQAGDVTFIERGVETTQRGLYIVRTGAILTLYSGMGKKGSFMRVYCHEGVLMHDFALLPRDNKHIPELLTLGFLTYTEVVFVPRAALLALFEIHPKVWTESARWCAVRAMLFGWASSMFKAQQTINSVDRVILEKFRRPRLNSA